jgi:hypothetical protein
MNEHRRNWHHLDDLPTPMIPYARQALIACHTGQAYSELGWSR